MKPTAKMLTAITVLAILPLSPSFAQTSNRAAAENGSIVLNGQVDLNQSSSVVNTDVKNVAGNTTGSSSAAGNNLSVFTLNNATVDNSQYVGSTSIAADQNANVQNTGGMVTLSAQAVCNAADVSTDPHSTNVNSNQVCNASDPSSQMNATVLNAGNDVSVSSQSVGNSYSEDSNAAVLNTRTNQVNTAAIAATTNAKVKNVNGNVSVGASAIGNNAQIIQY